MHIFTQELWQLAPVICQFKELSNPVPLPHSAIGTELGKEIKPLA